MFVCLFLCFEIEVCCLCGERVPVPLAGIEFGKQQEANLEFLILLPPPLRVRGTQAGLHILFGLHFNFGDSKCDLAVDFAPSSAATSEERIAAFQLRLS